MNLTNEQFERIIRYLIEETGLAPSQVRNTVDLLQEGATVPFIARYRKERTGELDEVQVRLLEERLQYFVELEERKVTILNSISEQGKLTPELQARIVASRQKNEIEDLYLPFKPKRRTKATIAREQGLEPLAAAIISCSSKGPSLEAMAAPYVDAAKELPDVALVLAGAGHILAEDFSESADVRAEVRRLTFEQGVFYSKVANGKEGTVSKFEMYYDYREPLQSIPSHRMLAMRRGEKEEILRLQIEAPEETILARLRQLLVKPANPFGEYLQGVLEDAYRRLIAPSIEVELRLEAKKKADEAAITVFSENLRNLLLAAPAGAKCVLGIDPGLRTGSKLAVVDGTGRFLDHLTIYPHTGGSKAAEAETQFLKFLGRYPVEMIAIGNGTASREMDRFAKDSLKNVDKQLPVVTVNEAGASVYSASDIAREEFPDLDLTVRGAISIARRLQDPLAELVKIDAKSIGVGQYQHDVNQRALQKSLDAVVESCVNYVGVDLNTASWALLSYVSGISESLARSVVRHRDENGPFPSRQALLKVSRFGAKTFEQAAGFLRIRNGENPLDNTAVHPENYAVAAAMLKDLGVTAEQVGERAERLEKLDLQRYVQGEIGLPTLRDIVAELKKPGRDPRDEFQTATFRDDVTEMTDLQEGMVLQGTVTNVTAFGAFVDVGVHQDGLVHVSHLADRFVKDPNDVVKVGDIVKVKVLGVDLARRRISLSIKDAAPGGAPAPKPGNKEAKTKPKQKIDEKSAWEKAGFRVKGK